MWENPLPLKQLAVRKPIHTGTDVFDPIPPKDPLSVWYESRTTGTPLTVSQIEDRLRLSTDDVRGPDERVRRALIMAGYMNPRGEVVSAPSNLNQFHREMRAWGLSRTSKASVWPPETSSWAAYRMLRSLASEQGISFPPVYKGWKRYEDNPLCRQCGTVGTPSRGCRRVHVHGELYCCSCWESLGNVVRRCRHCRGVGGWGRQNPRYSLTVGHRDPESPGAWESIGFETVRKSRMARQKAMSRAEELKREGYDVELRISPEPCVACRGRGHVYGSYRSGLLTTQSMKESCPACKGTGSDPSDPTVPETIPYEGNPLGREVSTTRRFPVSVRAAVRRVMRSRRPEEFGKYYLTPARGGVQVFSKDGGAWYVPMEGEWNPSLPATGKYSVKPYRCTGCGTVKETGTNHWGSIYPYCDTCRSVTVWECLENMPRGYRKPEEWKIARLGDVADIEEGRR